MASTSLRRYKDWRVSDDHLRKSVKCQGTKQPTILAIAGVRHELALSCALLCLPVFFIINGAANPSSRRIARYQIVEAERQNKRQPSARKPPEKGFWGWLAPKLTSDRRCEDFWP